ncbi:hypothetical protein [Rhizobium sp. AC44/96]|nr:hypothetical protein [Rhizobium sp. AC44/96]
MRVLSVGGRRPYFCFASAAQIGAAWQRLEAILKRFLLKLQQESLVSQPL